MDYNVGLMNLVFYVMIGSAIYITQNPWVLLALVFTPSCHSGGNKKEEE